MITSLPLSNPGVTPVTMATLGRKEAMYRYRNYKTGEPVHPSSVLKDSTGEPFVFIGACPDDPYWVLGFSRESLSDALTDTGGHDVIVRRLARDFTLTPERESTGEAFAWFVDDEIHIAIKDGRTITVTSEAVITVWSPDRMHGGKFQIPLGVEWSSSLTFPVAHVGDNQSPNGDDPIGIFIKCANVTCDAKLYGPHPWDSIQDVRAHGRTFGWGTLQDSDFCPMHGGKVLNRHA